MRKPDRQQTLYHLALNTMHKEPFLTVGLLLEIIERQIRSFRRLSSKQLSLLR
jgi:hypothetical protein